MALSINSHSSKSPRSISKAFNGGRSTFIQWFRKTDHRTVLPALVALIAATLVPTVSLQAAELGNLAPAEALEMQQHKQALIVDIRTGAEWQATGVIADSVKLQSFDSSGKFDAPQWLSELKKAQTSPDQPVILVCRSGNRSGRVGELLTKQLGMTNIYHLSQGIESWKRSGLPLAADCPASRCK